MDTMITQYSYGATSNPGNIVLEQGNVQVAIETISMVGNFSYQHSPQSSEFALDNKIRIEVVESVKKSLTDHADVWSELSKY